MTAWKINPEGVQGVLEKVQAAQAEIAKDLESAELEPVAQAVTVPTGSSSLQNGVTGSVMSALNDVFQSEAANIATIQSHIVAGLFGVANATHEYAVAQADMGNASDRYAKAAGMQAAMFDAATTGNLDYFNQNGQYRPDGQG